jgi:hypothetical protein
VQGDGEEPVAGGACADAADVDQGDHRQGGLAVGAIGQAQLGQLAGARQVHRLQRGRGRAEHHHGASAVGAQDGHVARVVAHALVLLEGAVVLLVHHHQPEVGHRREQRRARADGHAHLATPQA